MTRFGVVATVLLLASPAAADSPDADALEAWHACVAALDARHAIDGQVQPPATVTREIVIERVLPPDPACASPRSATIEHWRGSVIVPGATVVRLLDSLQHELPHQDDVLAGAFLQQSPDRVRVYLRIVRRKIIAVVLDTEHDMRFDRRSPSFATSRSEMTRVSEVDRGDDRGFLWRLNAWTEYVSVSGGVLVRMDSLTLSRSIPGLLKPLARPVIDSIGRESMRNTLEGIRRRFQ